jgi:hypothetical protein
LTDWLRDSSSLSRNGLRHFDDLAIKADFAGLDKGFRCLPPAVKMAGWIAPNPMLRWMTSGLLPWRLLARGIDA